MNYINPFGVVHLHFIVRAFLLVMLCVIQQTSFAATATQQIISNMAIGEYSEEGSSVIQVSRSNLVQTTILPVYSVNLSENNTKTAIAGQTVYFNHTLTNTGNGADQYTLTASNTTGDNYDFSQLAVFLDRDNNGIPDDNKAITSYPLAAGESVSLIVAGNIPADASLNQKGLINFTVNSLNNASGTTSNLNTVTVTNQSTLVVRKKFSQTTVANGDIITVRLDYQNASNTATGTVKLVDTLDASLMYQSNSGENWNGLIVNPSEGSNDPTGINYTVSANNVVTAVINSIAANTTGYLEFKVKVNQINAIAISNTVNVEYDHDNNTSTANITDKSNTAVVNVAPIYAVKINGSMSDSSKTNTVMATPTTQGGEIRLNNYIWNTGNIADRFNLTFTSSTFPTGSQIEFYRIDGITPLLDSNGDGIPDTGLLASGTYLPIIIKVRFPSNYAVTADTTFEISPQAQSIGDITKKSVIKNEGTLVATLTTYLVDLTNSPENNGVGNGNVDNAGSAWKSLTVSTSNNAIAGGQAVFPLSIKHTGTGTEYTLSANANADFSRIVLPDGVSKVRFYLAKSESCATLGAEIGKTIYLNDGQSQTVCAVVAVNAINQSTTVPIYFRVLSTSFVSGNTSANPSQDIIKNAIIIQSVNAQNQIEFMPNARGQVSPLGTVIYSHFLKNNTATDMAGSYGFIVNNDQEGFQSTLFYDVNNNSVFDAGDLVVRTLSDLPDGKLIANQQVHLLLQVKNLLSNNIAQTNTTTVNLTSPNDGSVLASITDVTLVNQTQLKLTKLQARDFNCDGTADEAYSTNSLSIGKQDNGQGQCVLYKITLTNASTISLETAFTFRNMTPAYTVLFQSPNCTSCSSVIAPTVGNTGTISGVLNSVAAHQSYDFNFGVRYVGD